MLTWDECHDVARQAIDDHGALQTEYELAAFLAILSAMQPVDVIELGTWAGGLAWALLQLPSVGQVITVDYNPRPEFLQLVRTQRAGLHHITGDTAQFGTLEAVTRATEGGEVDVLIIDGAHDYKTAYSDFETYRHLVRPGGLVALHDSQGMPDNPFVEVPRLWAEVRAKYPSAELYSTPGGPAGWGLAWVGTDG